MTDLSADNKIINGLWGCYEGETLSNLERLCIHSFCANGHDFRLWSYYDIPNLPRDTVGGKVEMRDAGEILSRDKIFYSCIPHTKGTGKPEYSPAVFADWFRWELLRKFGGWWADMDIVCLRPFDFERECVFGKCGTHYEVACMRFPRGHPLAESMAESNAHPTRIMPWDNAKRRRIKLRRRLKFWLNPADLRGWGGSGGPIPFSSAVAHFGVQDCAIPEMAFYSIPWWNAKHVVDDYYDQLGILQPLIKNAYAISCTNSEFKASGIDKNGVFPANSPFEELKRRYLPELRK